MSSTELDVQHSDSDLPKGWVEAKLGEVYELEYGKGLTKTTRNTDGVYPVFGSNGVVDHHDAYLVEGPVIVVGRKGAAGAVSSPRSRAGLSIPHTMSVKVNMSTSSFHSISSHPFA